MAKIICLIGVIGSGKDYKAKQFIEDAKLQGKEMVHINFADELREMSRDILGWRPQNNDEYDNFKSGTMAMLAPDYNGSYFELTGREFLQRLGTEAIRKRDKDFWTKCWSRKVYDATRRSKYVVCSDLRFINELQYALEYEDEVKFIFCDYHSERYNCTNNHESEKLAQRLLALGYKDGQEIPIEWIKEIIDF